MHLGVIHIAVREAYVVGVHTEGHDWSVIDYAAGIDNLNKRTIVLVTDGTGLKSSWRELLAHVTRRNAADRRKINRSLIEYQVSVLIQIRAPCTIYHQSHLR